MVLGSVAGAPGVTTTALAAAAAWPADADGGVRPVVVEGDPSGGDVMMRFGLPTTTPSLLDVAAVAGQSYPGSVLAAVHELPFGVRVVPGVPGRGPCREAVRLLAGGIGVLRGSERDLGTVLLDVGRLTDDVEPLLAVADRVVVVTRGGAEALAHVPACGLDAAVGGRLVLVVVGPCPYPAQEIASTLGVERVLFLPWDARCVAAMSGPRSAAVRTDGFRPPRLMTAARLLARQVAGPAPEDEETGTPHAGAGGLVSVAGVEEDGA